VKFHIKNSVDSIEQKHGFNSLSAAIEAGNVYARTKHIVYSVYNERGELLGKCVPVGFKASYYPEDNYADYS
jgi:hypothetical protein